jgi:hypothetical protein
VASTDQTVCRAFFDVANLLKPATTLFSPRILGRVVAGSLRGDAGTRPQTGATPKQQEAAHHA